MVEKLRVKKLPFRFKFELNKKNKRLLVFLVSFLVVLGLLFGFKHWLVSAVVNGRPIFRLSLDRELEKQYGEQTLESLITETLILQEAKKQKIKIGDEAIGEEIEKIRKQVESQGNDLEELLTLQGQSMDTLREQIKIQLIIEEILGKDVQVSDEEAQAYFEENQETFFQDQEFEQVKENIKEQLGQQQMAEKLQTWLKEIKNKAKVFYFFKV